VKSLRRFLHHHGYHRFCRVVRVPTAWRNVREYLIGPDGDSIDITALNGVPTKWREEHR
jgi:hypothetical protein